MQDNESLMGDQTGSLIDAANYHMRVKCAVSKVVFAGTSLSREKVFGCRDNAAIASITALDWFLFIVRDSSASWYAF